MDDAERPKADVASRRRNLRPWTFLLILGAVAVTWNIFSGIDDWNRDLTSNHAALDPQDPNPLRRPFLIDGTIEDVITRIENWASRTPRWAIESVDREDSKSTVHLTRTSLILRFVDDVHVSLRVEGDKVKVNAESQSRIGKGDLGQNPRNLEQLVSGLRPDR